MGKSRFAIIALTALFGLLSTTGIHTKTASAGMDGFINPYFTGYLENGYLGKITAQNTVMDMTGYNGVRNIGDDVGKVVATSEYTIENVQAGATFCYPIIGDLETISETAITVNGAAVTPEILYGDTPYYYETESVGYIEVLDAIASVQPTTLIDGVGKLYEFETSENALEFSFKKESAVTVFHHGYNNSTKGQDGYSFTALNSTSEEYPYRLFVMGGELSDFTANVQYKTSEVSYNDYVKYYLDEWIAEIGEEYRPVYYSQFNRRLDGQVADVFDILLNYSHNLFALFRLPIPTGTATVEIVSTVKPLVHSLYKPYVYIVRTITPYPQAYDYTLRLKTSELLPYVVETSTSFENGVHSATETKADGYFIVSSEQSPERWQQPSASDSPITKKWLWLWIVGGIVVSAGVGFLVWWIWGIVEKKVRK